MAETPLTQDIAGLPGAVRSWVAAHAGAGAGAPLRSHEPAAGAVSTSPEALFEHAVRTHTPRLLAIARAVVGTRASAEDVVQQALVNLYQHRHRYDWQQPGGLLRRAVVNEALRILRQPRMAEFNADLPARPAAPDGRLVDDEMVQRVRAAIDRLPEHFRAALVLCEYEGMAYAQIAEVLGASVPQIKTWLHRARRRLEGMLREYVDPGRNHHRPP
jgi:RNA polymerase sigma-70 factor (ECF subfamily)